MSYINMRPVEAVQWGVFSARIVEEREKYRASEVRDVNCISMRSYYFYVEREKRKRNLGGEGRKMDISEVREGLVVKKSFMATIY